MVFEGLNSIGLRRRGFNREAMDLIDKAYISPLSIELKCFSGSRTYQARIGTDT